MRYIGSKNSLVKEIHNIVAEKIAIGSFCDPFGGIGVVGSYFKEKGYEVTSGDVLNFPYYFQTARIANNSIPSFTKLFNTIDINSVNELLRLLNSKYSKAGWFIENYSINRQFFTIENALVIEGCRNLITDWCNNDLLLEEEKALLLASLINSMDRVANTAGTYYAHLKSWYRKALKPFKFDFIYPAIGNRNCKSYHLDAFDLVKGKKFDVLYLDPPYNQRNYERYYHLPESLANQKEYLVGGKSGSPQCSFVVSDFNKPQKAFGALEKIIANTEFRLLLFHYTDSGIINPKELKQLFSNYGRVEEITITSKNGYSTTKGKKEFGQKIYTVAHG